MRALKQNVITHKKVDKGHEKSPICTVNTYKQTWRMKHIKKKQQKKQRKKQA